MKGSLAVRRLGLVDYETALTEQERLVAAHRSGEGADTLLLLEHPPVVTLGRGGDAGNVLATDEELARRGIEKFETGRGGDATFHGPGQLVGYPILALPKARRDAHRYLRDLEQALIDAVARFGVAAGRVEGLTGIWVGDDKLAAIGVRLNTGWITSHGFALNVDTELSAFETIVPCGIRDRGVTSLARLLDEAPPMDRVATVVAEELARTFGLRLCLPAEEKSPCRP